MIFDKLFYFLNFCFYNLEYQILQNDEMSHVVEEENHTVSFLF
jgi:hypothetical protein